MNKLSVQNFVRNYSIETTVREAKRVERFADIVGSRTRLYIAHTPSTNLQDTIALAARLRWEGSHGADIGRLPVTVGLPGLATARTLLKYAMDCGIGASLQAFSKRYASLAKLLTVFAPDDIVVALALHKDRTPQTQF